MGCCGDTGVQAAQESAPPPAAHGVAGCNPFDAPPLTDPRVGLDFEGLDSCGGEGSQGTPGEIDCMYVTCNGYTMLDRDFYAS